jgi:hypothetical protein
MSTAQEIEQAIRSLSASERDKLLRELPAIFSELGSDAEWDRIIKDEKSRRALTQLLNETEADYARQPEKFSPMTPRDFDA